MLTSMKTWWSGNPEKQTESSKSDQESGSTDTGKSSPTEENSNTLPVNDDLTVQAENKPHLNEEFKKAYETAKHFSTHMLSLGKSATEIAAKNVSAKAKHLAEQVKENEILASAPVWGEFNREQKRFIAEQQQKLNSNGGGDETGLACMSAGYLPWEDCENPQDMATLRQQVLDLSMDERHFLRNPPPGANFEFTMTSGFQKCCLALLSEDDRLKEMRFRLVPRKVKEDAFWRNYFYRISLIKQSHHLRTLTSNRVDNNAADNRSPGAAQRSESSVESYDRLSDFDDNKVITPQSQSQHLKETSAKVDETTIKSASSTTEQGKSSTAVKESKTGSEDEWEEELQKELQAFEVLQATDKTSVGDDDELEREIMEQLELEKSL